LTTIRRDTKETQVEVSLQIYGNGENSICTKIGFFDHMLEAFAKHAHFNLELKCEGDRHIDFHHSVEDSAIVLGEALYKEIYPIEKIERFGEASVVMDEACVNTTLDLSNRPFLYFDAKFKDKIGEFDTELIEEFFRALCFNAGISAHIVSLRGKNSHHIAEALFKSFAIALRRALSKNERCGIPSTKGVL